MLTSTKVWDRWQQGVWDGSYLRQRSLRQENRQIPTKAILFGGIERLPRGREYLKTIFSSHVPPKDDQHFLQRSFEKANDNISIFELRSTHGKANNQAPQKAEMEIVSKKHYKVH